MIKKYSVFYFFYFFICFNANAQVDSSQNHAKVYIIRPKEQRGEWGNWRIIIDSNIVCKISSGKYGIFNATAGLHTFNLVSWYSPKLIKRLDYELKVENGKNYYLKIAIKAKGFKMYSIYDEITYNSAKFYVENYTEDKICDK